MSISASNCSVAVCNSTQGIIVQLSTQIFFHKDLSRGVEARPLCQMLGELAHRIFDPRVVATAPAADAGAAEEAEGEMDEANLQVRRSRLCIALSMLRSLPVSLEFVDRYTDTARVYDFISGRSSLFCDAIIKALRARTTFLICFPYLKILYHSPMGSQATINKVTMRIAYRGLRENTFAAIFRLLQARVVLRACLASAVSHPGSRVFFLFRQVFVSQCVSLLTFMLVGFDCIVARFASI